jgi:Tfp pilus assembly protein PilO
MKLGFGLRLALVIVVTVIAFGTLGYAWVSADTEYQAGRAQVEKTKAGIQKSAAPAGGPTAQALQLELDRVKGETEAALKQYPVALEEAGMLASMLNYAETDNISLRVVGNREGTYKTDNYLYPVSTLVIMASGEIPKLLDFVNFLESARTDSEKTLMPELRISQVRLLGASQASVEVTFSTYGRPAPAPAPVKKGAVAAAKPKAVPGA